MTTNVARMGSEKAGRADAWGCRKAGRPPRPRPPGRTLEERNRLVLENQGLVRFVARNFRGRGLEFDDLVSEGQIGLLRAAELYDPAYGTTFAAYATRWVRVSIANGVIARGTMLRIPHGTHWRLAREEKAPAESAPGQAEPDRRGTAGRDVRLSPLDAGRRASRMRRACEAETASGDDRQVVERQGRCDAALARVDDRDWAECALARLDERDAAIVRARFGIHPESGAGGAGMLLREVGRRFGIGSERARQLTDRAVERIRAWSKASREQPEPAAGAAGPPASIQTGNPARERTHPC